MKNYLGQTTPFYPALRGIGGKSQRGFTLIELIVTITIIVILAGMLLNRIWFYQEQAEKAAMEQVAGALQSALIMQYGHLLANNREAEAKNLIRENPTRWLQREPANYVGEFPVIDHPGLIEPGNWAFSLGSHELVYVPYRTEFFTPGKGGLKWVRYRARLEYERSLNKAVQGVASVLFEPVEPYQWLIRGEK